MQYQNLRHFPDLHLFDILGGQSAIPAKTHHCFGLFEAVQTIAESDGLLIHREREVPGSGVKCGVKYDILVLSTGRLKYLLFLIARSAKRYNALVVKMNGRIDAKTQIS
jgi:hypothetical protein